MEYIVEDKEFKSYKKIAEHYGVDYVTFMARMKRWNNIEKSALEPINDINRSEKVAIVINGVTFNSIEKACKFFNVDSVKVHNYRRYKKVSTEEAINYILYNTIEVDGTKFSSIREFCKKYKIPRHRIDKYVYEGKTPQQVIDIIIELYRKEE